MFAGLNRSILCLNKNFELLPERISKTMISLTRTLEPGTYTLHQMSNESPVKGINIMVHSILGTFTVAATLVDDSEHIINALQPGRTAVFENVKKLSVRNQEHVTSQIAYQLWNVK